MIYRNMVAISLYRVIGRIGMMTLDLEMVNEGSDMGGRTWDRFHDMLVMIGCPHDHGFAYMCSESFRLLFMMWGDVI